MARSRAVSSTIPPVSRAGSAGANGRRARCQSPRRLVEQFHDIQPAQRRSPVPLAQSLRDLALNGWPPEPDRLIPVRRGLLADLELHRGTKTNPPWLRSGACHPQPGGLADRIGSEPVVARCGVPHRFGDLGADLQARGLHRRDRLRLAHHSLPQHGQHPSTARVPVSRRAPPLGRTGRPAPRGYDHCAWAAGPGQAGGRAHVTSMTIPALLRDGARAVAAGRVALGLTALAWPSVPARPWVGSAADDLTARVFGRALGARDLALGLGALAALQSPAGEPGSASAWVAAGALSDALDVAASLASWRELPRIGRWLVVASAGGAALTGAAGALAVRASRDPASG